MESLNLITAKFVKVIKEVYLNGIELLIFVREYILDIIWEFELQWAKVYYYINKILIPRIIWIGCQLSIFVLALTQKALAILYSLQQTTIKGAVCIILVCYLIDVITNVNLRIQASRQAQAGITPVVSEPEEFEPETFRPVYFPGYEITFVHRGFALLSYSWPLAFLFLYFPDVVDRMHPWFLTFNHIYLRGLVIMFGAAKFLPIITLFTIFHGIVRRRGQDTIWVGNVYYEPWYIHFVRYHWCYSLMNCIVIYMTLNIYSKTERSHQMSYDELIIAGDTFFYLSMALIIFGIVSAILGRQPRIPLFHRACIFHCGQLKNDPEDFKDLY